MFSFEVKQTDGKARLGRLVTGHGAVDTPMFMPVGTAGTVKGVTPEQLRATHVQMILANTYHLMLRPGAETAAKLGGLHCMMGWDGPLLTDSGGYQVFSLARMCKVDDSGLVFQSHIDGVEVRLGPERAVEVQRLLGADVIMQLDECPPADAPKQHVAEAVRRSADWAERCKAQWLAGDTGAQALFGIQQGGIHLDLRGESARRLVDLDLPGYAIGGLKVGEEREAMTEVVEAAGEQLPAARPRYLMGVGEPREILSAVGQGVDMFDCVLPTRNGRNAQAFTWTGRLRLRNARWSACAGPLYPACNCYTCRNFSRGALRHLFMAREMLGPTLVTIHNLHFFVELMASIRRAIAEGNLARKSEEWLAGMYGSDSSDSQP